mgnify:FL=1
MIYEKNGEQVTADGYTFAVGERIMATNSDYAGLKGYITEIRTGADKETENETDDVYCYFDFPESEEKVRLLEKHFSALYGEKKTRDDICLDSVIMAPEEIRRLEAYE